MIKTDLDEDDDHKPITNKILAPPSFIGSAIGGEFLNEK